MVVRCEPFFVNITYKSRGLVPFLYRNLDHGIELSKYANNCGKDHKLVKICELWKVPEVRVNCGYTVCNSCGMQMKSTTKGE